MRAPAKLVPAKRPGQAIDYGATTTSVVVDSKRPRRSHTSHSFLLSRQTKPGPGSEREEPVNWNCKLSAAASGGELGLRTAAKRFELRLVASERSLFGLKR